MLKITERNFNAPYADILEMPTFDFLKYYTVVSGTNVVNLMST